MRRPMLSMLRNWFSRRKPEEPPNERQQEAERTLERFEDELRHIRIAKEQRLRGLE